MYNILQKPQNSSWNVLLSNPCFILCERAIKRSFSATNQCEYNIILTLQRPRLQLCFIVIIVITLEAYKVSKTKLAALFRTTKG